MPVTTPRGVPIKRRPSSAGEQGFVMLLFQSFSAGATAVLVTVLAILALVGIYAEVVWPYTRGWTPMGSSSVSLLPLDYFLVFIFIAGSAAGFWCFSGAAFRNHSRKNSGQRLAQSPVRSAKSTVPRPGVR